MAQIPELYKMGLPSCIIYDTDSPEQVVKKVESSSYVIDGRTKALEFLPDYYFKCKKQVGGKQQVVARHKFF